jgi:N-acetylmuramoyl-L-alanine amidase
MPTQHTVQQGDCLSNIAEQYGIPWKTVWNHPDNADIKQSRKDPNVLYPGDIVNVPDKDLKEESRAVDARHKFKKKGEPTHIKIRLLLDDQPRSGLRYQLVVNGTTSKGSTDGGGYLRETIPPDASTGVLIVGAGTAQEIFQLGFGTLDPIETDSGVRGRLEALGYEVQEDLAPAVRAFQSKEKLEPTGVMDDSLRAKLKEKFGQ